MASILHAYVPGKAFPAISVTGTSCGLMCAHCQGRHLRGMRPALSPEKLREEIGRLAAEGAEGFLLSGGCDERGRVPLDAYVEVLVQARRRGLKVNLHPGICDGRRAELLAPAADTISLDLLCDDEAARSQLHLPSAAGHVETMKAWVGKGPEVVPHLLVGLGSEGAELQAIQLADSLGVRRLILLSLIPGPGQERVPLQRFLRVAAAASAAVPETALGCMRPRGDAALEIACIDLGIRHIANPSHQALEYAKTNGLEVRTHHACCSL